MLHLGGNALACQILYLVVGGVSGHGQDPAALAQGAFGIDEIGHMDDLVLHVHFPEPVQGGYAGIQDAVHDIAANFLHPVQGDRQFGVIDIWEIVALVLADFPACTGQEIVCGSFQGALGHAELKNGIAHIQICLVPRHPP